MKGSHQSEAGFALLDAMIGVLIAGACVAALLSLLVQTSRSVEKSRRQMAAWAWAQALVETAPEASSAREVRRGVTPDGDFAWTLTLEIEGDPAFERASADIRDAADGTPQASLISRRDRQ